MTEIHDTTVFHSEVPTAVTLGKFDGLHRGHQKLIREILRLQEQGCYGIVFTIAPENQPVLLTEEEKCAMLEGLGVDCMIRCPFVPEILSMEPEQFVSQILAKQLKAKYIVVGTDFRFGHDRKGDVLLLKQLQEKYDFRLIVMEKECHEGSEISSTRIRDALAHADMELAGELLGFAYPVEGIVRHGKQLGRKIGMPTINQIPDWRKLLPPYGVYFSTVRSDGRCWQGVTNIGCKPTVDGSFLGVETYLYGVNEDLYGRHVQVSICSFRRPEQRFASVDELKMQMEQDILAGKRYFGLQPGSVPGAPL